MLSAWAQQQPDAGSLSREVERRAPVLPVPSAPLLIEPAVTAPAVPKVVVRVNEFVLTGVTLMAESDLQAVLLPFKGRDLSFTELQKAADAVAQAYRRQGYLVRAGLPEQDLSSGRLMIAVVEGRLSELRVDAGGATLRLREDTVRRFLLSRQKLGDAIRADDLQRGISLLNDQPGIKADLLLEPGRREGESLAVVRVRDEPLLSGTVQMDNTGVLTTGSQRAQAFLNLDDPLGMGDQLGLGVLKTSHSDYGRLAYSLPVGGQGLRVGVSISRLNYDYTASGSQFAGTADITSLTMGYPLLRGVETNINVVASVDDKHFQNTIASVEINNKQARVATLGLSADRNDALGGGGVLLGGLHWSRGDLNLERNSSDFGADQTGAQRQGSFDKFQFNLARLQQISVRHTAWLAVSGQAAGKNLDSSEKFSLGGVSGVRAYPSGEASGDDGWLMTAEWRYQLNPAVQLSGFYDRGGIKRDHTRYAGTLDPNSVVLSGAGVGVKSLLGYGVSISASAAWRIGDNPLRDAAGKDSDGSHRSPRVWLSVSKTL